MKSFNMSSVCFPQFFLNLLRWDKNWNVLLFGKKLNHSWMYMQIVRSMITDGTGQVGTLHTSNLQIPQQDEDDFEDIQW